MVPINKILCFGIGLALAFPLFFTANLSVFQGGADSYEFSVPLSFFLVAALFGMGVGKFCKTLLSLTPLLFTFWVFGVAVLAVIVAGARDVSLLALYLVPAMAGFFLPWCIELNSQDQLNEILRGFAVSIAIAAGLHLLSSFVSFGVLGAFAVRGEDSIFGLFSIYQKFIYYSTLLAVGAFLLISLFEGYVKWVAWVITVVDILLCGAREAAILLLFLMIGRGFFRRKGLFPKLYYALFFAVLLPALLFLLLYMIGDNVSDFVFLAKISDVVSASSTSELTGGRSDVIRNVMGAFDIGPFFLFVGSGFATDSGELGTPHNQYIEWFLRGGLVFLIGNISILFLAVRKAFSSGEYAINIAGWVILGALLISNNINTPFRAPYSSVFVWVLVGCVCKLRMSKPRVF